MERKRYYVTVGSGEVLPDKTLTEWEYEIDATPEEAERLEELFEKTDDVSWNLFWKSHIPMQDTEDDTIPYDKSLHRVYEMIYQLGTEPTKEHIRSMGILH